MAINLILWSWVPTTQDLVLEETSPKDCHRVPRDCIIVSVKEQNMKSHDYLGKLCRLVATYCNCILTKAILLRVEWDIYNLAKDFWDFQDSITSSLNWLHENKDETYKEVKRVRKEQ